MRAVEPLDAGKAPSRQFEHVGPLATADIENPLAGLELEDRTEGIHLLGGDLLVIDDVAVRLQIGRVEDLPPPFRIDVGFQVGDGAQ